MSQQNQQTNEKKHNYFYKITNLINGKYYYGIHSTNNLNDGYMGSGIALRKAYKKYGMENFIKEIIINYATRKEVIDHEIKVVTIELIKLDECYNNRIGGSHEYNTPISEETRKKISEINKGRVHSEESKLKMSLSQKERLKNNPQLAIDFGNRNKGGKYITEESRRKMSESRKKYKQTKETRIKATNSRKNNGKPYHSDATKQKMSDNSWLKKLKGTPEMSKKMSEMADKRKCIINGEIFESIVEVAKYYNITPACAGRRLKLFNGKFKNWKYFEE